MIQVGLECLNAFASVKKGASSFALYRIDGGKVIVDYTASPSETFMDLVTRLPEKQPLWILAAIKFMSSSGGKRSKLLFIRWVPSGSSRVDKMQYAMFSSEFKSSFEGIQCSIQANDLCDLDTEEILSRASQFELDPVDLSAGVH